ncbi:hypothetical protein LTS17_001686 [Exophiala oligosperma]
MIGTIDQNFVGSLLPRLAHTYDFIWDTIVSSSYLIKYVPYLALTTFDSSGLMKVINREHRQALNYYHRAIVNVRKMAQNGPIDDCVVVLSYIQFAGVEFRQRNVKVGHSLFKKACGILTRSLTSQNLRRLSLADRTIYQVVTPFLFRKAIVIATLGDVPTPEVAANDEISQTLSTKSPELQRARVQLYSLVVDSYELVRIADFIPNLDDSSSDKIYYMSFRQSTLDGMREWKANMATSGSPAPVATSLSASQIVYDDYMDGFAEIIRHAKIFLRYGVESSSGARLLSKFDPGVLPLLYFCATKCRDPTLRREAFQLMRQALRQEQSQNHWAFIEPERVVAKLIALEESGVSRVLEASSSPQTSFTQTSQVQKGVLPPDERRYAHASAVLRETPGGRSRLALDLVRFEITDGGQRQSITEYVWLDDHDE